MHLFPASGGDGGFVGQGALRFVTRSVGVGTVELTDVQLSLFCEAGVGCFGTGLA